MDMYLQGNYMKECMRKSLMWCFSTVALVGCNFEYSYTDVSTTEGIKSSFSSTHRIASSRVDTDCIEHVLSNNPQFKLKVFCKSAFNAVIIGLRNTAELACFKKGKMSHH